MNIRIVYPEGWYSNANAEVEDNFDEADAKGAALFVARSLIGWCVDDDIQVYIDGELVTLED